VGLSTFFYDHNGSSSSFGQGSHNISYKLEIKLDDDPFYDVKGGEYDDELLELGTF